MALTAEEKALRIGRLTGTTLAGALGVHDYMSPLEAKARILGLGEFKDNERMKWGRKLERIIADDWAEERGLTIVPLTTQVHPTRDYLAATGDFLIVETDELLEIKTANDRQRHLWGEQMTDAVPYGYLVQVITQMGCYDKRATHEVVLFGGQERKEFYIQRDLELEQTIFDEAADWHARYIVGDEDPSGTAGEMLEYFKEKYATSTPARAIESTDEVDAAILRFDEMKKIITEAEAERDAARVIIEAHMKDAEVLFSAVADTVTWKSNKPSIVTDYKQVALALNPPPELIRSFTRETHGARPLRVVIERKAKGGAA